MREEERKIAEKMMKVVTGGKGLKEGTKKGYRNICKKTGRSRGVIEGKGRMEWRKEADKGEMEGKLIRRGGEEENEGQER